LFDCTTAQLSSQEQCQQFCELIRYQPKHKKPEKYYYDAISVPMLHADYQGKYNANKIFLGPLLFMYVHTTITLGPVAVAAMMTNLVPPKVQSIANLWGLRCTTPGMIAVVVIWA
ncbi:hypothetical protein B0H14DRAFT_2163625, partial [Mycena olivaceomarginata]